MALQEFLVEGRGGGRCVMYKILNEQVPQFEKNASSKGVTTERHGKGRESSTIFVCSQNPDDLSSLKEFVKEEIVFTANKSSSTAA
jgi:hypothetical protein